MRDAVAFLEAHKITPVQYVDYASLDQGHTGHCVGFGCSGLLASTPVPVAGVTNDSAHALYYKCKALDGEPGAEDGSTVRTGAKALQQAGRIGVYFFASSINEAAAYVDEHGPIVLGIDWFDGMFTPDASGIITPGDTAAAGGHCILWYGISVDSKYAVLRNSWGPSWGIKGDCKISIEDLNLIFSNNGEALAATEVSPVPPKPKPPKKPCRLLAWLK